jgi:hypothetical protein
MANSDVTSSNPSGATLPPSPSPSTVALGTGGPSPRIEHLQPKAVGSRVYQAIAEVNGSFEKLSQHLQALQQFNFFPADNLIAWLNMILNLQADANSHLLESLHDCEMSNAAYYDRLCLQRELELRDPDDVLIEAEHRRQELAAEEAEQDLEGEN